MGDPKRAGGAEPDPWLGDVGFGVSAWLDGAGVSRDDLIPTEPPEWAGPLPDTPFVPDVDPAETPRQTWGRGAERRSEWAPGRGGRSEGFGSRKAASRAGGAAKKAAKRPSRYEEDGNLKPRKERKPKLSPEEAVAAMTPLELEEYARKIILDQLTGQARSRKELNDKLAKKFVPEELVTRLLDRFEEVGLIDDEAYARMWIASRQPGKGLAGRALAQELRRKGIDDEVVKEAVAEIDPEDERDAAERLVAKKMRSVGGLDRQVATRRLVGMLARKGYNSGLAFSVVREALDAHAAETEEEPDWG
ncbi:regulatory protein RecX [Nocardioides yefusunii]|uniref:Regulatory protein RecX n=1 Tax=Nocardioides yefusunii TaxID=2500546 RepID=A0ABW1QS14_9ACTN|nr:regulatory protein RecX [Nocardioides yefusunii]